MSIPLTCQAKEKEEKKKKKERKGKKDHFNDITKHQRVRFRNISSKLLTSLFSILAAEWRGVAPHLPDESRKIERDDDG